MADNSRIPLGTQDGDTIALDDIGGIKYPRSKITLGADGTNDGDVSSANPLPVTGTITGVTTVSTVTTLGTITNVVHVDDNSGSLTVDNSILSVVGGGTEATAQRVTIASDSTGVLSVDDNGGSLTVDGTGTFQVQVSGDALTSLQLLDDVVFSDAATFTYGTSKEAVVAGVVWDNTTVSTTGATRALSLTDDMELRCHDADAIASLQIIDNAVSGAGFNITQFGGASVPIGAGLEATAVRVTLPTDGTGKVSAAQSGTWNVTNISGTVSLPTGAATEAKQPALGVAGTASSDVLTVQGIASMTAIKVDGSAVTQPVSGTFYQATQPVSIAASVTVVNSGTFATQSTLQAGTAYAGKVRLTDGTTDADVRDLLNSNAINVSIVDGSGDQITAFGGGTQYTEGDTDATIVGTAMMMEVTGNALQPVQGSVAGGLVVDLGSNNDVTVTGTVTANIGTVSTLSTAANQTTIIGHVDGIETLLGTIDADTGGIATSAATIAGAVSGTEMQVDVLTMPTVAVTGTFWQATQPVSGTVTATISAGATTIAKAEDAAHTTGDTGVFALTVRSDTAASTAGTDGDYAALTTDSTGKLHVNVGNTVTVSGTVTANAGTGTMAVSNAGTFAVQAACTNSGTFAVQVDGTALTRLTDIETNTDSGAVVGNGAAATAQRVTLANDSTGIVALTTSTASIGKLASNTGVTIGAVEIAAAQTLATVTTVSTVTTCSTVTTVSTLTGGGVAHDSADSGNPVKVGARAAATLSDDTMVANADRTDMVSDLDGALIVRPNFPMGDILSEATTNTDGSSTASGVFTATASTRSCITWFNVSRNDAGTTPITIDFRDGTAGSVLFSAVIPPNGGSNSPPYQGPCLFRTSANTALAYDVSAATSTVRINVGGFKSKV